MWVTLLLLVRQRTNKNNKSALFDNAANLHECVHSIPYPLPLSLSHYLSLFTPSLSLSLGQGMEMSTSTSTATAASSHANRRKVSTTSDTALNQFQFYCCSYVLDPPFHRLPPRPWCISDYYATITTAISVRSYSLSMNLRAENEKNEFECRFIYVLQSFCCCCSRFI